MCQGQVICASVSTLWAQTPKCSRGWETTAHLAPEGQTEAWKDKETLLPLQSQGWLLALLMAHLTPVTMTRWPSGAVQYWAIVSACSHPSSCPTIPRMQ